MANRLKNPGILAYLSMS